jgi:DNA polymerase III delta prime subunit
MSHEASIPWIEKYRPDKFDNIVLDPTNRVFFQNILAKRYFPNVMFYGPPGTGKTTTILNLIQEYQQNYASHSFGLFTCGDKPTPVNTRTTICSDVAGKSGITARNVSSASKHKENVIHLNASDERGIDIIRSQINQFVKSNHLFEPGLKFVILDEVDYMTKNAQQALKTLLQTCRSNVRYCLICNYISKIDESLRNEFVCVRFNQLPKHEIHRFIRDIAEKEGLRITPEEIDTIQHNYNSDIRSMINFLQLHASTTSTSTNCVAGHSPSATTDNHPHKIHIIRNEQWLKIHRLFHIHSSDPEFTESPEMYIHKLSIIYNTDKRNILNTYFNYVIRHFPELIADDFLSIVEHATHMVDGIPIKHVLQYVAANLYEYYSKVSR